MPIQTLQKNEVSSFCDSIKLRDFNQIQSYGVLLVLDKNLQILQCSENAASLLETSVKEILNQPISKYLKTQDSENDITSLLHHAKNKFDRMSWQANGKQLPVSLTISRNSANILIEIELDNASDTITEVDMSNHIIRDIEIRDIESIDELCQIAADEIKSITGYNRVLIYKFDDDQSGIVVGQALDTGMDSYFGLSFPATDIPQPVRKMYLTHPLRYIPDTTTPNVKIIPESETGTHTTLDLSAINLRMIAPIHAEYLLNMGVKSTCSIALILDKKLWGLIVFHHRQPKFLTMNDRRILLFIAKNISAQLLAIESATKLNEEQRAGLLEVKLNKSVGEVDSLNSLLEKHHEDMMEIVSATGMSMYFAHKITNYGITPANQEIHDLVQWLDEKDLSKAFAISDLPLEYPSSITQENKICGLLAVKMIALGKGYLIFYRPERVQTKSWAGNPNETLTFNQTNYSPRNTFDRYLTHIINTSTNWTERQIKSAYFIQTILTKQQLQDMLKSEIKADKLSAVTMLAAGVAHEINNPLGYVINNISFFPKRIETFQRMLDLIQGLIGSIKSSQVEKIQQSCDEISSFAKTNNLPERFTDIKNLVTESMEGLLEIQSIVNDMKSLITKPGEDEKIIDINSCVQFAIATVLEQTKVKFILHQNFSDSVQAKGNYLQMQTVFLHLFKNSVQAIEENGEITVSTAVDNGDIVITFTDNGHGIEPQNLKNLFSPFFTVESAGTGRGLGLSLSYNIVKLHGGTITAKSKPGSGSVFAVRLPNAG